MEDIKQDAARMLRWTRLTVSDGMLGTRRWSEFAGKFALPKLDWAVYERRVVSNVAYFKSNYVILALVASLWTMLRHPRLPALLIALGAMWAYTLAVRRRPVVVGKVALNAVQKVAMLSVASILLILLSRSLFTLLYVTAVSLGLILAHASLRPANIKTQFNKLGFDAKEKAKFGWESAASSSTGATAASAATQAAEACTAGASTPRTAPPKMPASAKQAASGNDPEDAEGASYNSAEGRASVYAPVDGPRAAWEAAAATASSSSATTTTRRSISTPRGTAIYQAAEAALGSGSPFEGGAGSNGGSMSARGLPRPADVKAHEM